MMKKMKGKFLINEFLNSGKNFPRDENHIGLLDKK